MFNFDMSQWSQVDYLMYGTIAAAAVWLILTLLVHWRRSITNLTPVDAPRANRKAQPDFLSVDKKKQKKALKRGAEHERMLDKRERAEAKADLIAAGGFTIWQMLLGYLTLLLSVICLFVILAGSIWPESAIGNVLSQFPTQDRLMEVIQAHPIALLVSTFAVIISAYRVIKIRNAPVTS